MDHSTTSVALLAAATFFACAVEAVEALTIVLAAGTTRGWRSALMGAAAAVVVLVVVVAVVGLPLAHLVPLSALRVAVGGLLLVLGLGWLRKAILRASGYRSLHDEDAIYSETVEELAGSPSSTGDGDGLTTGGHVGPLGDAVGFAVAFKGVFLEGMEVVLIVVSLGASSHQLGLAAAAAAAAVLTVGIVGLLVARQLREVPENALKFGVGVVLTGFGTFWVGEGLGSDWPGSDAFIVALVGSFAVLALAVTGWLVRRRAAVVGPVEAPAPVSEPASEAASAAVPATTAAATADREGAVVSRPVAPDPGPAPGPGWPVRATRAFFRFWVEFLIGDTPELFVGVVVVVAVSLALRARPGAVEVLLPVASAALLVASTSRGAGGRSSPAVQPDPATG